MDLGHIGFNGSPTMVSNLKNLAIGAVATAGLLFCQAARAGLLMVNLGGFICADNIGGSTTCDANPAANAMTVVAGVGGVPLIPGYGVAFATTFSNNPGTAGFNILDMTWSVASLGTAGGPLTILVSQTDWNVGPVGPGAILQSVCSGDVFNGTMTCQGWTNLANTLFGLGPITPGPQGPVAGPFTSTALSAPYVGVVPYSITDRLIFSLGPNGTSSGDLRSITQVPEPATLALIGAALAGVGFARRRRQS
jgi:hypothetical protein